MAWQKLTLTTAANTADVHFQGRGAIYAEGTFGGGLIQLHVKTSTETATGYVDDRIDGTSIKTIDCPSGDYQLNLAGSTGATVDVFYNDQIALNKKIT